MVQQVEGKYAGKLFLTSRQELEKQPIEEGLPQKAKSQFVLLNEVLCISDGVYKVDIYGNGLDKLVTHLKEYE